METPESENDRGPRRVRTPGPALLSGQQVFANRRSRLRRKLDVQSVITRYQDRMSGRALMRRRSSGGIAMKMPVVNSCEAEACAYNTDSTCRALAITVGNQPSAYCDTFLPIQAKERPQHGRPRGSLQDGQLPAQRPVRMPGPGHQHRFRRQPGRLPHLRARLNPVPGRAHSRPGTVIARLPFCPSPGTQWALPASGCPDPR